MSTEVLVPLFLAHFYWDPQGICSVCSLDVTYRAPVASGLFVEEEEWRMRGARRRLGVQSSSKILSLQIQHFFSRLSFPSLLS